MRRYIPCLKELEQRIHEQALPEPRIHHGGRSDLVCPNMDAYVGRVPNSFQSGAPDGLLGFPGGLLCVPGSGTVTINGAGRGRGRKINGAVIPER